MAERQEVEQGGEAGMQGWCLYDWWVQLLFDCLQCVALHLDFYSVHTHTHTDSHGEIEILFVGLVNVMASLYSCVCVCVSTSASEEPFLSNYCCLMSLQCRTAFGRFGWIEIKCHSRRWVIPAQVGEDGPGRALRHQAESQSLLSLSCPVFRWKAFEDCGHFLAVSEARCNFFPYAGYFEDGRGEGACWWWHHLLG